MTLLEQTARAIAAANGDDYDAIPRTKSEWNRAAGRFGGRVRDINEPMRGDYDAMAAAALAVRVIATGPSA